MMIRNNLLKGFVLGFCSCLLTLYCLSVVYPLASFQTSEDLTDSMTVVEWLQSKEWNSHGTESMLRDITGAKKQGTPVTGTPSPSKLVDSSDIKTGTWKSSKSVMGIEQEARIVGGFEDPPDTRPIIPAGTEHVKGNRNTRGPRILCWVMTTYSSLMSRAVYVHDTWGKRCDKLLFFISNGTDTNKTPEDLNVKGQHNIDNATVLGQEKTKPNDLIVIDQHNILNKGASLPEQDKVQSGTNDKASSESETLEDYGKSNRTLPIVYLDIPEGRRHLTAKTMGAFHYISVHYINEFDWFLKADDDTYVVMENLRHFLSRTDKNKPVYFGHHFKRLEMVNGYNSGGSGYVLSRKALELFINHHKSNPKQCPTDGQDEDVHMGRCLQHLGVTVGNTADQRGAMRFLCFTMEQHLMGGLPKWTKLVNAYSGKTGIDSISRDVISFHYVKPWMMRAMEYFIYKFSLRSE